MTIENHGRGEQNSLERVPLLRQPAVCRALGGIGKTTLWRWIREGRFPKAIRLGANCVAWREDEVNQWIASRPRGDESEG